MNLVVDRRPAFGAGAGHHDYGLIATTPAQVHEPDTPGHSVLPKYMVTGASTANLAIILIDARNSNGRPAATVHRASLPQIQYIVVCINKWTC